MPIDSEPRGSEAAIGAARAEARQWAELASRWTNERVPRVWDDLPPVEAEVVGFFDPAEDLERRTTSWQHQLVGAELAELARFAAGLAVAEADAWRDDQPHLATRAFADRRHLAGDRILHWAVPWLDTVGRCYPDLRHEAHADRDVLLAIADFHRPAPPLGRRHEGLYPEGHDSLGPMDPAHVEGAPPALETWLGSLWSGAVLMGATLRSLTGDVTRDRRLTAADLAEPRFTTDLVTLYEVAAIRWRALAERHPGAGRLWLDLAERADRTAAQLVLRT